MSSIYYFYGSKRATKLIQKVGRSRIKKVRRNKSKKLKKKKTRKIDISTKSSQEILTELSNKKELLELFEDAKSVEKIAHLIDKNLTVISEDFLFKVDQTGFSDIFKREFLKEMLSFSPNDRMLIADDILISMAIYTIPPPIPEKEDQISLESVLVHEELTFQMVQEYLEKNRQFNANKIVPYLSSRFAKASININRNGINKILKSLVEKNAIIEGSTLVKEDILINANRTDIFEFIKQNPGVHFNKLFKKVNLSNAVVRWHVNVLVKFSFIKSEKIDNHDAYFEPDINPDYYKVLHLISREKYNNIIDFLKENDYGTTKTQLSRELGMHLNTITKYIDELEEAQLILKEKKSNKVLYFLNEEYYNLLKE